MILLTLTGCVSERHFARDSLWPFGNPNAPDSNSENAERALGQTPDVTPIAPQAGNVWPGNVQPVPTIADIEKNMNQPLGQAYAPSLPSPYPPGQQPPDQGDQDDLNNYPLPSGSIAPDTVTPGTPTPGAGIGAPSTVAPTKPPGIVAPGAVAPNGLSSGVYPQGPDLQALPANPHARE